MPAGTDRIAEVVERLGLAAESLVVNVQGRRADDRTGPHTCSGDPACGYAGGGHGHGLPPHPGHGRAVSIPTSSKVVLDHAGLARYFSRAPVPFARDAFADANDPSETCLGLCANAAGRPALLPTYRPSMPIAPISCVPIRGSNARSLKDSKRSSSCGRFGTATRSPSQCDKMRRSLASTRPKTWNAHGRCLTARIIDGKFRVPS